MNLTPRSIPDRGRPSPGHRYCVAPSILAANFGRLEEELRSVEQHGGTMVHLDVMDGRFVPPITFGTNMVELVARVSTLYREVHLMVTEAERHFEPFIRAGAERIVFHLEEHPHAHRLLGSLRSAGVSTGVSINPGTAVEAVSDVLDLCDVVLIMSVNPGWGGQSFIPRTVSRIQKLKEMIDSRGVSTLIEVDGGINKDTAQSCVSAGASILVAGTAWFGSPDRTEAFHLAG